jgi:hypothetical protein
LWDLVPNPEELTGWDLATTYLRAFTELENTGSAVAASALAEEALTRLAPDASPETAVSLYCAVGLARSTTSHEAGHAAIRTAIQIGKRIPPTSDYVRCLRIYAGRLADRGMFAESREHLSTARGEPRVRRSAMAIGLVAAESVVRLYVCVVPWRACRGRRTCLWWVSPSWVTCST